MKAAPLQVINQVFVVTRCFTSEKDPIAATDVIAAVGRAADVKRTVLEDAQVLFDGDDEALELQKSGDGFNLYVNGEPADIVYAYTRMPLT